MNNRDLIQEDIANLNMRLLDADYDGEPVHVIVRHYLDGRGKVVTQFEIEEPLAIELDKGIIVDDEIGKELLR